jgi:glyoxylase-like metal-dependent hydrolase (beta-lactamase superfamily II)
MGANAILQESRGVPVFAHKKALPVLSDPEKLRLLPYQKLFFGEPRPSVGKPIGDTVRTERHKFRVLHSPGHSPDHVVLYEGSKGWLFSGDTFIGGQDRVFREGYDITEMTRTLRKLSSLGAEVMFTGMGNVVRKPERQLARKIAYFEEVSNRIQKLRREGMDPAEIARRLFPGDFTVRFVTSGNFSSAHLVRSFLQASGDL